jgi:uncharacterized membrane protein
MAAGVFIRHFFNLRHKGRVEWRYPAIGVALLAAVAVAIAPPKPAPVVAAADPAAEFAKVKAVIDARCLACHAAHPTQPGFAAAPLGVAFDSAQQVHQNAEKIYKQVVQTKAMPLANLTNMTDAERAQIAAWYESGAQ